MKQKLRCRVQSINDEILDKGFPTDPIELDGFELRDEGGNPADGALHLRFGSQANVCLEFATDSGFPDTVFAPLDFASSLVALAPSGETCSGGLLKRSSTTDEGRRLRAVYTPQEDPLSINTGQKIRRSEAILLNGPDLLEPSQKLDFSFESHLLSFERLEADSIRRRGGRPAELTLMPSAKISIRRREDDDQSGFDHSTTWRVIERFWRFLILVTGRHCGIGNVISISENEELAAWELGFLKTDPSLDSNNWYDYSLGSTLPDVFDLFCKATADEEVSHALVSSVQLYGAAQTIRRTAYVESSIIAAHGCLEVLVNSLLKQQAGWSEQLLNSKSVPFHAKLRAAYTYIRTTADPLEFAPSVDQRTKSHNNCDAFEMISIYRNKIAHEGTFRRWKPSEATEIFELIQWLNEIFLLHRIGYFGRIADRRNYTRFRGTTVPVPYCQL